MTDNHNNKTIHIERLDFNNESKYSSIECSIHLCRYLTCKQFVVEKDVLDVACGEGYGSKLIKQWGAQSVVGIDISEDAVDFADEHFSGDGIRFVKSHAEKLPFYDNSFDVVVSYETIEHVDDDIAFLREIKRVCKDDGVIIISCPNDPYYYKMDDISNPFHKRKYTWFDFKKVTEEVFGKAKWNFGFALNGFVNIGEELCTQPEDDKLDERSMIDLFDYEHISEVYRLRADRYLNHWNANYYLGIWGTNKAVLNPGVIFPREIFLEPDDPIFADINRWNIKYRETLTNALNVVNGEDKYYKYKAMYEEMLEQIKRLESENIELISCSKENKEENEKLKKHIDIGSEELKEQKSKYNAEKMRRYRTESLLEVADKEKQLLWDKIYKLEESISCLEQQTQEYERYKRSYSYKLMEPVRRVFAYIKRK